MRVLPHLGLCLLASLPAAGHAQKSAVPGPQGRNEAIEAPPVIITGNPLGSALLDMVRPADVLEGAKLGLRLESTLGETLAKEAGVSSSYFGPNASRPIIRGLDGERVRILQNGTGVLDASGSSPDHGVAVEPLTVERIEIVRGPATLLYGGSAIGGVVNAIDNRIPAFAPDKAVSGSAQLRLGGAADERAGVVKLDGGTEAFALHVDAFRRDTSDLRIPGLAWSARKRASDPTNPDGTARDRLPNSASTSDGMAVGGSALFDRGYFGVSAAQYNSNYGTVVERDVLIDQRQNRYDVAGEMRDLGFVETAKFHAGYTDYRHVELAGGVVGTTFTHRGYDARLDLRHRKVGILEGAFGFQLQDSRFRALGDEAFIPPVSTRTASVFVYEEAPLGPLRLSAGARVDSVRLQADEVLPGFTPAATRDFTPSSGSVGVLYPFGGAYAAAANLSYTERAPNYAEVFANGPHVATGQFEVGDRGQRLERSTALDLALRKRTGSTTGSVGVFAQRFANFIALLPTGVVDGGTGLPISRFEGVRADLRGVEAEARFHIVDVVDREFHVDVRGDYTRAQNATSDTPLPRIAPVRLSVSATLREGNATGYVEAIQAGGQNRVAANELPTDGYTLVNARLTYRLPQMLPARIELFVRANNLLNEEIRMHTSTLKDIAPMGGRSVMVGVNGAF